MRSDSIERPEYFWAPRRIPGENRHARRDEAGRVVRRLAGASGRPRDDSPDSLRRQIDAVTGSVRSWLLTGTRRIPIDPRRRQGVHEGLRLILTEDEESVENSSQEISESMKRHAIVEAMNRLPDDESQVIKLAYFGGQTNEEIAVTTGIPLHSVRRRLRQGLRQMQAHLESTGVVDLARGRNGRRGFASLVAWWAGRYLPGRRRDRTQLWGDVVNSEAPALIGSAAPAAVLALGIVTLAAGAASAGHVHLFDASNAVPSVAATVTHKKDVQKHQPATAGVSGVVAQAAAAGAQAGSSAPANADHRGPVRSIVRGAVGGLLPHGGISALAVTRDGTVIVGATGTVTSAAQQAAGAIINTTQALLPKQP